MLTATQPSSSSSSQRQASPEEILLYKPAGKNVPSSPRLGWRGKENEASSVDSVELLLQRAPPEVAAALRHCGCVSTLRKELLELLRRPTLALPFSAEELTALGESAVEMEELEEVIRCHWPNREERQAVQQKLLLCGIESASALLRALVSRASGGRCHLNEVFADAGFRLLRQQSVDQLVIDLEVCVRQRIEVVEEGHRPVLVTAPHNIFLLRDGEAPHVMEEYTTLIAQRIARQLGGTSLSWSRSEQYRSELLWSLARHQGHTEKVGDLGVLLDPRNRDPNYLVAEELMQNLWFQQVSSLADQWRDSLGRARPLLHVDVHGCRDPPCTPSHLTVGLAAMRHEVDSGQSPLTPARFQTFIITLEAELSNALRCLDLGPKSALVRVLAPDLAALEDGKERLSGACPPSVKHFTQSQQAVSFAKFTHSCQLEMSKSLRRVLVKSEKAVASFSKAISKAWSSAISPALPALPSGTLAVVEPGAATTLLRPSPRSKRSTSRPNARRRCSSEARTLCA